MVYFALTTAKSSGFRYKGTVMAILPEKLQFVVHYDDGEKETLILGKERVRLLSTNKKS